MNADPELHLWVSAWAQTRGELTARPMFGCPAWFRDGKVRVCVIANSVTVKGEPTKVAGAKSGCSFAGEFIAHGRSMGKNWVSFVPPDRDPQTMSHLSQWIDDLLGDPSSPSSTPGL